MELPCRNCSPLTAPDNFCESSVRTKSMRLTQYTGQVVCIHGVSIPQITHNFPVFVPGEHQAKVGEICQYSVERENVIVFELLDQNSILAESLCRLLAQRRKKVLPGDRDMLTLSSAFALRLSRCTLRTLSNTLFSSYSPVHNSVVLKASLIYFNFFTTPSS